MKHSKLSLRKVNIIDNVQVVPPTIAISDSEIDEVLDQMQTQAPPPETNLLTETPPSSSNKRIGPPALEVLPGKEEEAWKVLNEGLGTATKRIRWNDELSPSQLEKQEEEGEEVFSPLETVVSEKVKSSFHINVDTDTVDDALHQIKKIVKSYKSKFNSELTQLHAEAEELKAQAEQINKKLKTVLDRIEVVKNEDKLVDKVSF